MVAVRTTNTRVFQSIDQGLASYMVALVGVINGWFLRRGAILLLRVAIATACPFASIRTFVGGFTAVIEAVCASAGFTAEWEEIKLATVFELTVASD